MITAPPKLQVPKRHPKALRRPRLLDTLHSNIHRKLTFVCAPAGYGKSTLLIDLLQDVAAITYWVQIGKEDTHLQTLFHDLVESFKQKSPNFGKNLPENTNLSPRILANTLIDEVIQSIDDYCVLFIDDYHLISEDSDVIEFVEVFLELLPDNLRLVIGSRTVFGIPTATLYIQEQLMIMSESDLKFTKDELVDLCSEYYEITLTDPQAEQIIEESEGWIVSILLALRTNNSSIEIPKILGAREHVYRYLADEVIQSQPKELIEFMLGTSIVDSFDAPFANHLLDISDGENRIKELEDLNLFLTNAGSGGKKIYRYHQLFSDFLQGYLGEDRQDDLKMYHQRAGTWFEQVNIPEKAVSHFFASGQVQAAGETMDKRAKEIFLEGKIKLLLFWYDQISKYPKYESVIPNLYLYLAKWYIDTRNFMLCEKMITLAEPHLKNRIDKSSYVGLLISKAMFYRYTGKYQEILDLVDKIQKLTKENSLDIVFLYRAERLKGLATVLLGDTKQGVSILKISVQGMREILGGEYIEINKLVIHDMVNTLTDINYFSTPPQGDNVYEAKKSIQEAVELSRKIRGNYSDIAMTHNNYANMLMYLGEYQEAWLYFAQSLNAAELCHNKGFQAHITSGKGDLLRGLGELEESRSHYENAIQIGESVKEKYAVSDSYKGIAEIEYLEGSYVKALHYIRESAIVRDADIETPLFQSNVAKVYLGMGQLELAQSTYKKVFETWGELENVPRHVIEAYYFYAFTLFQLKDYENAIALFKKCLEYTAILGVDEFLVILARQDLSLFVYLSKSWESPQILSIINRAKELPLKKEQLTLPEHENTQEVVASLHVSGFGDGLVQINNSIIPKSDWLSMRARSMFYFILDNKKVSKDDIALEFWPEFSSGKVTSNFHTTLWRARNALGGKHMIQYSKSMYQINPDIEIVYDIQKFDETNNKFKASKSDTEKRSLLQKLVDLYQNDFLPGIDMKWADTRRENLRFQFSVVLEQLSKMELELKNYSKAEILTTRLIEQDPYQDQSHFQLMVCLVAQNKKYEARKHFQNYERILNNEMGIEPAEELTSFVEKIR